MPPMLSLAAAVVAGFALFLLALGWLASFTGGGASTDLGGVDVRARAISIALEQEPPQLDSSRATDHVSHMVLGHIMEGLLRYDVRGELVPGVAERWDIGTERATFWLRPNAVWSDGKPVTAADFVFAWKTAVDPATASQYAFIFYAIKNGEAINTGKRRRDDLGVRAVSDRVLEVTFENPIAFFDKLVAFSTYCPIREDFYQGRAGRYGADAGDMLYNGPFRLTQWVHGSRLRLEKNQTYWNRDAVRLDVIDIPYITADSTARINLYRDGRIAGVDKLGADSLDLVLQQRWPLGRFSDGSVWFLQLNQRPGRQMRNLNFRKALQLVNDNGELLNKVLKVPSYLPATSFFPSWLRGERALLRQEYPPPAVTPDVARAKACLELARRELGGTISPLVLLVDDTPGGGKHAEYLQNLYRRALDLDVRIDKQIFKQRLAKAEAGEFDIVIYGWGPDYDDPLTFGDFFASWNLNNHARYSNPKLDDQVRIAQRSLNQQERMAAFGEIQRILIEDVVIIPNYERGQMFVEDPRLRGVRRRAIGAEPDYTSAYLVEGAGT
jgi:oligopeptide transport system substrate-binding protein